MLSQLDDDVLFDIFELLDVRDILSLRLVSQQFDRVSRSRTVWHRALLNHVKSKDIPLARACDGELEIKQDISTLTPETLERLTRTSLMANESWYKYRPTRHYTKTFNTGNVSRVFRLAFLKIQAGSSSSVPRSRLDGRFLLSVAQVLPGNDLRAQVWDTESHDTDHGPTQLDGGKAGLVSEWTEVGRAIGVAEDEGHGLQAWASAGHNTEHVAEGALFAISERQYEALTRDAFSLHVLHFVPPTDSEDGRISALKTFTLRGPVHLRALHDHLIAVQVRVNGENQAFGHGALKVVDWIRSSSIITLEHADAVPLEEDAGQDEDEEYGVELIPSQYGVHRSVLAVHFVHDWAIVFRESAIEMYFLPPSVFRTPSTGACRIRPTVTHKWPWQLNSLAAVERASWAHEQASKKCTTCHREGFVECSFGESGAPERLVCHCRYGPISVVIRFDSYFPWPVNLIHHYILQVPVPYLKDTLEVPYTLPPKLLHTVPSTVRLFGHSVLTIGRYGELLWTDSESVDDSGVDYFLEGSGERLSGTKLILPHPSDKDNDDLPDIASLGLNASDGHSQLPNQRTMEPAAAQGSGSVSSVQMSEFSYRKSDSWFSLAQCERAGRIAVGDGTGGIEVFDFI